jgi:spermidine synthase
MGLFVGHGVKSILDSNRFGNDKLMKPRIILAQTTLADGSTLELHEHDGRRYLHAHGQQWAGTGNVLAEEELAKLGTHPFRPARQPRVWVMGLGLGALADAVVRALPQKKAEFTIYEPVRELTQWQKTFFAEREYLRDSRVRWKSQLSPSDLAREEGGLHAILLQADACPMENGKLLIDDKRWLGAMRDSLQQGGVLGITANRIISGMYQRLRRAGFDVVEHFVESHPAAKKPRRYPIWLTRKQAQDRG